MTRMIGPFDSTDLEHGLVVALQVAAVVWRVWQHHRVKRRYRALPAPESTGRAPKHRRRTRTASASS